MVDVYQGQTSLKETALASFTCTATRLIPSSATMSNRTGFYVCNSGSATVAISGSTATVTKGIQVEANKTVWLPWRFTITPYVSTLSTGTANANVLVIQTQGV
jgi:hypothetical protein